jgi:hypothetical protein
MPWLFALLLVASLDCQTAIAKDVTLSWDKSPTPTVTGYRVYTSLTPDLSSLLLSLDAGNALTLTVQGLTDENEHYFGVKAYDDQGSESVYSNIVKSLAILPKLDLKFDVQIIK